MYLERGRKEEFFILLAEITQPMLSEKSIHNTYALELYYAISIMLLQHINRFDLVGKIPFHIGIHGLTSVDEHSSWEASVKYIKEIAAIIFSIRDEEQNTGAIDAVSKIKKYIQEHLSEDLSLGRLSEIVYFNPSYLSRLFKNVTGVNLIDYITESKIELVKKKLEDPHIKIHDVASAIGIESAAYFARFFKKNSGITPQEYRDSFMQR
jgi:two-component system response regulator YesN